MVKNNAISLFYFAGLVLLGLLLANGILVLGFLLKGGQLESLTQHQDALLESMQSKELLIMQLCSQVFSLILPAWIYQTFIQKSGMGMNARGFAVQELPLIFIFFLSCMPLVGLSSYLNQLLPFPEWVYASEQRMSRFIENMLVFEHFSDFLLALVVIAIIPAIAEEWVFRGILQKHFSSWTKNPWIGLLLASLFFSAIHMQFLGFLPRFILGLALGYVYMVRGNLWYPILLHFFNNGIQVIGAYWYTDAILGQLHERPEMPNAWAILLGGAVFVTSAYFLYAKRESEAHA